MYIAQNSPHNADRFLDRIHERCLALADFPQIGTNRDKLKADLGSQSLGNYLIFYFSLEYVVDVVRAIHGSRDIESPL